MSTERIWELMARKLAGEASGEELGELEQLLRTNPGLHFPIQAVTDLWQQQLPQAEEDEGEAAVSYRQHIARMQEMGIPIAQATDDKALLLEGARSPRRRYTGWWVAGLVALLGAASVFYLARPATITGQPMAGTEKSPVNEITTRQGSKTKVQLPDGTHVWLNAGSKLTYGKDFGNTTREVRLIGEGYFDVVRNEKKPFIIHTSKMDVKVLGTRFNVKSYPNDHTTEAALIHGSIEVLLKDRPAEKIILKPNEKIVIVHEDSATRPDSPRTLREKPEPLVAIRNLTYQKSDSTLLEISWLGNKLAFENESFKSLAHTLERWYGVSIHFTDEQLATTTYFTGVFEEESIEQVMRALQITAPFTYNIQGKTITISR